MEQETDKKEAGIGQPMGTFEIRDVPEAAMEERNYRCEAGHTFSAIAHSRFDGPPHHCPECGSKKLEAAPGAKGEASEGTVTPIEIPLIEREKPELVRIIERMTKDMDWYVDERNRLLKAAPGAEDGVTCAFCNHPDHSGKLCDSCWFEGLRCDNGQFKVTEAREAAPAAETPRPPGMRATLDEGDRQLLILALAELAIARPGFDDALSSMADLFFGRALFDEFKRIHTNRVEAMVRALARLRGRE